MKCPRDYTRPRTRWPDGQIPVTFGVINPSVSGELGNTSDAEILLYSGKTSENLTGLIVDTLGVNELLIRLLALFKGWTTK